MKIAITSTGNNLNALVDPVFGRCAYFIIAEVENNEIKSFESIANEARNAIGGAGIQAAQLVANKGAEVVITGNVGPNAFNVLASAGIKVVTGLAGISVKDAVQRYLQGELKETTTPTTSQPFMPTGGPSNMPGPTGLPGRGAGMGRGMGRGRMGGFGLGPGGECVCPKCGFRVPHQRGIPCFQHKCPKCGTPMVRA